MSRPRATAAAAQRTFAAALLDPEAAPPPGIVAPVGADLAGRFAVHRNNVLSGLVEALGQRFPAVAAIVGDPFFAAAATEYSRTRPPLHPVLAEFGDRFPEFLADFPPAAGLPYLGDVARIEAARTRLFHGADPPPPQPAPAASAAAMRVVPAADVAIVRSRYPVVTIWEMNAGLLPPAAIAHWVPERAMLLRREDRVPVLRIGPAEAALVAVSRRWRPLAAAFAAALSADPGCDPVAALTFLIEAGAVAVGAPSQPARNP